MKLKKVVSFALGIGLAVGVLAGCNGSDTASNDTGDTVELTWMMLGPGEQKDSEMVWNDFNEKLNEVLPNTKVNFRVYPTAEYAEKYKLVSAANEPIDLIWVGWVIDTVGETRRDSYMELDQLIAEYAPDILKEVPTALIDSIRVDGKIYQIPNYQMMTNNRWAIATHKDLSDQYWDTDRVKEVLYASETMTEECYDIIEEYLEQLKQNDQIKLGVSTETFARLAQKGFQQIGGYNFVVRRNDPNHEVLNAYTTPEMKLFYDKMHDWYEKGYIRKDILTVQNPTQDEGNLNGYVLWSPAYFDNTEESLSMQNGFPIAVIPQNEEYYFDGGSATGTAISSKSEHPERAMQLLDLMNTQKGKDLYNELVFGIEGTHYNKVSDTRAEVLSYQSEPDSNSPYGQYKWVIGNTFNAYEIQSDPVGWNEYVKGINEAAIPSPLIGFMFDNTNVKIEQAQVDAIVQEFSRALNSGAIADYDAYYAEMMEKLDVAGMEKLRAEIQRQVDEFVASK